MIPSLLSPQRMRLTNRTQLALAAGELLVVRARLRAARHLGRLLTPGERRRQRKLRFAVDRDRHAAAHGLKRLVLAALRDCPPGGLALRRDRGGKPRLQPAALHFNLSHSGDWVVLAVSRRGPVGIDIEASDPQRAANVLRRVAHPNDPARLLARPRTLWAAKEALTKGVGLGLSLSFTRLRLEPVFPSALRCRHAGRTWWILSEHLADGSDFAVAFQAGHRRIRLIDAL